MKVLLLAVFLFSFYFSFSQDKIVSIVFLKNNGKYVDHRDSADYFRVINEPDSGSALFNVFEYYKDGKKKLVGKSSTVEFPRFEGPCALFYKNGSKQSVISFKKGIKAGTDYEFYPNGKPYLIKDYPDNGDRFNDINNNYLIQANYDSLGTVLVENGRGHFKGYDDKFKEIVEEGDVNDGKRDRIWSGAFKNVQITFTETYKNGDLIQGVAIFADSIRTVYFKTRGTPPQFKGGIEAFGKYLSRNINYPDYARENNIQGKVIIGFNVEKDGKLSDVRVSRSVDPVLDAEAVKVIKNCPKWLPATEFGRSVRTAFSVPVSFSLN